MSNAGSIILRVSSVCFQATVLTLLDSMSESIKSLPTYIRLCIMNFILFCFASFSVQNLKGNIHRHVMIYQCKIMAASIYHSVSGSQSCHLSFLCSPYIISF